MPKKKKTDEETQGVLDEIDQELGLDGEDLDELPDEDEYPPADDEMENFYADFRGY